MKKIYNQCKKYIKIMISFYFNIQISTPETNKKEK
jgi:hypothetical protein